jgi:hypothetical protein
VGDRPAIEQLGQGAALGVAEVVVGHQSLYGDPVLFEELEGPSGEGGDGLGPLVVVDLRVGQPRAVVDDRVHDLPADPSRALAPVAGQRMAGFLETAELLDVHVQDSAGPDLPHGVRNVSGLVI